MQFEAPSDDAIGPHEEAGPAAAIGGGVRTADPHVIAAGSDMHRRGLNDSGKCRGWVEGMILLTDLGFNGSPLAVVDMAGMIGMKHELYAEAFVGSIEFRIPAVDADECAASHAFDVEHAEMVAGRVMCEIPRILHGITAQEPFVIPVDDPPFIIDDIEAVVRLVRRRQPMRGAEDYPELQRSGDRRHLGHGRGEPLPVYARVRFEVTSRIAGKSAQAPSTSSKTAVLEAVSVPSNWSAGPR